MMDSGGETRSDLLRNIGQQRHWKEMGVHMFKYPVGCTYSGTATSPHSPAGVMDLTYVISLSFAVETSAEAKESRGNSQV